MDHVENLNRYLQIVPSLVNNKNLGSDLHRFRIRHPDYRPCNVIVSTSSDSNQLKVVGLLDWQNAAILPLILSAGIPGDFQNYGDPVSQALEEPSLPANMEELDELQQYTEMGLFIKRFFHYSYLGFTQQYNKNHYDAMDLAPSLICRLFYEAGYPWLAEAHALKIALIEATELWDMLSGENGPCPITFEPEDVLKTKELSINLKEVEDISKGVGAAIGFGPGTMVPNDHYETAKALAESVKWLTLELAAAEGEDEEERATFEANWFLDDMDESDYM